ncbi:hypothetical protein KMW28_23395 [Flammeovirga yaeyamensis]|uniref:Uncharacterized protein n=1 Tax=Flammeovirga yaeyamensis TaxID=367791 RepID=A0AAX1NCS3_9BACT|nr:hypothetical protein [Flammeovirga yaeyamensis]MBB3696683.1 hypothetical protein [Flammeovirga yaeyamensis]NMF33356.1 hypothetical protein [Flammeovirga yaeyamensis]QWG05368.1 hypothetical protein KMW28_23395 [Flammeovirga yaeyamensis]
MMKYSKPINRKLKAKEYNLLEHLFKLEAKHFLKTLPELVVIGRCGCGDDLCPTIQLGFSGQTEIIYGEILIDYFGISNKGNLIGVSVLGNKNQPTELEFWSIDGVEDVSEIPDIDTLKPLSKLMMD